MPGSPRRRVWAQPDGRRVRIPAPEPRATPPPPAAAPPLGPPLPPARAAASSEDALVKGRGGADGCRAQSMAMAMADLLVQVFCVSNQPIDDNVPDAEGESSEMDTPFRGGAMPSVSQTGSGKAALLGKDSIHKATTTLQDKEKSTHLRFLVSNTAAGCIFGKGDSTINDFQSLSGAHIQFSCSHEFLPGTNDRIIMVSGLFDEVVKAMQLVLERLLSEGGESNEAEARPEFKLLVPNSSCGGIIGKGGATIKSFIEDSHAGIKISPEDNNSVDLHDMLVTITGSLSSQMRAIYLILSKLSEDVHYPPNLSSPFPYAGLGFPSYPAAVPARFMIPHVPYNDAVNYGPNGYAGDGGGRYQNKKPAATMAAAPPPALPNDLIEEILRRLPPDDPASLLCASLVCKTWSHIAKVKLKRAQQQEHLKRAQLQLHLKRAQQLEHAQLQEQLEGAQLQMQLQHAQLQELLERAQLQMQLKRAQLQEQLEGAQLQEQLECARLQELQEQLEGAQLKRTQLQTQLEGAQLQEQLERDQLQMQLECAQLQMQLERAQLQEQLELDQLQMQLECIQLQEELNQLQRRSASSSSRAPSCRRRSASSRGGQPAAQARPAWRY